MRPRLALVTLPTPHTEENESSLGVPVRFLAYGASLAFGPQAGVNASKYAYRHDLGFTGSVNRQYHLAQSSAVLCCPFLCCAVLYYPLLSCATMPCPAQPSLGLQCSAALPPSPPTRCRRGCYHHYYSCYYFPYHHETLATTFHSGTQSATTCGSRHWGITQFEPDLWRRECGYTAQVVAVVVVIAVAVAVAAA